jgi:intracellular septation protein
MKNNNKFFFISFIPALAYWYLEANYDLKTALVGGVGLAIVEISVEKILFKHVHKIALFNFYLIALLGGIAYLGDDGIWYRLQPFFTGLVMSVFLFYQKLKNRSFMLETLKEMGSSTPIPSYIMMRMEFHLAIFLLCYGCFMGVIAFKGSSDQWIFFKTAGFYIVAFIFLLFEVLLMRRDLKKQVHNYGKSNN